MSGVRRRLNPYAPMAQLLADAGVQPVAIASGERASWNSHRAARGVVRCQIDSCSQRQLSKTRTLDCPKLKYDPSLLQSGNQWGSV